MGLNTSQPLEVRSLLAQNWLPSEKDPHVFVHRSTHEQAHRHHIKILSKDLPRETSLFTNRMNSHQPYICRLLYFHLAPEIRHFQHERDMREMTIYTDRFLRLRQWTREKMVFALHGLRRLISVHGPMRISENMLGQNQCGEVKVWISENPANNYPDFKYMSEENSMADFAAILTKKNPELAGLLMGCMTLKEAAERLNLPQKDEGGLGHNHSHRDPAKTREFVDNNLLTPYKNVFGECVQRGKSKNQMVLTPKASPKPSEYPQSAFVSKEQEFNIQATNSITLGRYRDFVQQSRARMSNDEITPTKSHPKSRMSNQIPVNQGRGIDSRNHLQFNKRTAVNKRMNEVNKQFIYQPRFETVNNINSHIGYGTMKNKQEPSWVTTQQPNLASTLPYQNRKAEGNCFKQVAKSGGESITIINNNVNNYISNITHNHIQNTQNCSQHQQSHQFRTQSRKEQPPISPQVSNQTFKNTFKAKEKCTMPNFLRREKKPGSQWMEEPISQVTKCKSNVNLIRKDPNLSNPQESPHFSSLQQIEQNDPKSQRRIFNFSKNYDPSHSAHKSSTPALTFNILGPRTPPPASPQNFSSFQKGFLANELKLPLRTKTTQFYNKAKEGVKKDEIQNKSFTQHELYSVNQQKSAVQQQKKVVNEKEHQEEQISASTVTQELKVEPQSGKLQFKKQLRNQFKFLLGGDNKQGEKKQEQSTRTTLNSKADEAEGKQGNLKDKITRKQQTFAQLKKQALKVLTDD